MTILPTWGNQTEFDGYSQDWAHSVLDKLVALENETLGDAVAGTKGYFNGSFGDEKSSLVFGEKYNRLRQIKRKFDPDFVFKKWFPIVPSEDK